MRFLHNNKVLQTLAAFSALLPTALAAPASRINSRLPCQAGVFSACPDHTIVVSKDNSSSSSKHAHFTSIQSAILSLPHDNSSATILIRAGSYTEQLNITRPGPVTLLGETNHPLNASENQVTVYWSAANSATYLDNAFTSVLTVAPTQNASLTGAGPTGWPVPVDTPYGSTDFRVYNIDFRNVFSEYSAGPSLAVSVSYANAGFYYSGFYSYQDTVCHTTLTLSNVIILMLMNDRYTSANSATPTSTSPSSLAKPISCTVSAPPGSNHALYNSVLAEAALQLGRVQTPPTPTNLESTLSIPPSRQPMPPLQLRFKANVRLVDPGTRCIGQSLRVPMKMEVSGVVDIRIG